MEMRIGVSAGLVGENGADKVVFGFEGISWHRSLAIGETLHVGEEAFYSGVESLDDFFGEIGSETKGGDGNGFVGGDNGIPGGSTVGFECGEEAFSRGTNSLKN